ncbi:MAG: tetratricopeptide repeat protein [Anaerolineales bacterium]
MATISLRDYLKQTEELIDNGRIEDALTRCRQILETYPKHVDTYRMMGKAYLEAHRHGEASDLFQRVLSSCPDDFVSHIGMSIVREDEENLNAAIGHMERAFEAQPSNRAVQDELRRLYQKREGYDIPKVRLTRGALARMYAHGDLYSQAIGELTSALSEDPQRADLQVLLAEMYFKTNKETEAIDICTRLLEKLPYCLYANRVMANILKASGRQVEAQTFLDRVVELDPYAALTDARTPPEKVPGVRVMLETDAQGAAVSKASAEILQPTEALAAEEHFFEREELPDWLSIDSEEPSTAPQPNDELVTEHQPGEDLPAESTPSEPQKGVTSEIPDWLSELSPQKTNTGELSGAEAAEMDLSLGLPSHFEELDNLEGTGAQESLEEGEPATQPPTSQAEEEQDLSWLDELAADQQESKAPFLAEGDEPIRAEEPVPQEPDASSNKSAALAWLDELSDTEEDRPMETDEAPLAIEEPAEPEDATPLEPPAGDQPRVETTGALPDWLQELREETEVSEGKGDEDAAPMAPPVAEEPVLPSTPVQEGTGALPDWLQELNTTPDPSTRETSELREPTSMRLSEGKPDWLEELRPETAEAEEPIAPRPLDEAPDWLDELRPGTYELPDEKAAEPALPDSDSEPAIDWLAELGPPRLEETERETKMNWIPETREEDEAEDEIPAPPQVKPRGVTKVLQQQQAADRVSATDRLEQARQSLSYGKLSDAADHYGHLLRRRLLLDEVITDLDAAVHRHPGDATLWQTLGDAYMRNNELRKALDCYTKAEDLL